MTGYVIGPWVRGERFYGRTALRAQLLAPVAGLSWVAGCRRVGKTSLLRQLELEAPARGFAPLVWDLQGADDPAELALGLDDALLDAAADLACLGMTLPARDAGDVGGVLGAFATAARSRGRNPLLLVDEAEELLTLAEHSPDTVRALGETLAGASAPRVVMTSSVRLARLGSEPPGVAGWLAPALAAPRWLGPLESAAAGALVRQDRLPAESRPGFSDATVDRIVAATGGHPYLTQLLAKRVAEGGDVDHATASLVHDPAVRSLVAVDLDLLEPADRALCLAVAAGRPCAPTAEQLARLSGLGLVCPGVPDSPPAPGHVFL